MERLVSDTQTMHWEIYYVPHSVTALFVDVLRQASARCPTNQCDCRFDLFFSFSFPVIFSF